MPRVQEVKIVSAQVPVDLIDALTAIAEQHDRTFSAELRRALRAYVDAQPKRTKAKGAAA